ncbi:TolC family protein [Flavobacterium capsici]|uniref:TolC family protein n=1 Tax=Flavobacterium capsici TaxID=3075618 RepID=A0AA96ESS8_9FLAO|nr:MULTISPECIES: TolC family protein [unclassified Flavobacterium]WNM17808.1 TolC family protein [Flavobacterium sp. PMR2A8]WNM21861.1 TolC family protein [Flavobacterium sp. PMTSA4]
MKINKIAFLIFFLMVFVNNQAQEKKLLTLKDAIQIAVTNSDAATLAKTKVETSELELENVKNNRYPSLKASGQYMRLSNANVDSNLSSNQNSSSEPSKPLKVDQLLLGQVNASLPIFSGFKLKNSIKTSESLYQSEKFTEKHSKEQIGLDVVELFSSLYKTQQMTLIIEENLKTAIQRVKDFTAMEENGLIARNDLLKAQLQQSNIELALENSKKNTAIANHKLVTLLKLPESTQVEIDIEAIKKELTENQKEFSGERNDLKALELKKSASESAVKVAKGNYYPSLALSAGYIALDLNNVITVTNAMNFGIGLSYDLSSIFKNGKEVKLAQSKAKETEIAINLLQNQINEEVFQANENYKLSLKQSFVYEKAVVQATENYRIVKDKYDNSLSDTNDLLEADFEALQAKINQALSKADVAQKYYELQFANGTLSSSLNIN